VSCRLVSRLCVLAGRRHTVGGLRSQLQLPILMPMPVPVPVRMPMLLP